MCIPSSPYQPPQSSSFYVPDTPPTLRPLSFTSIDLDELMSSAATPAVSFIPPQLAEHASEQRIHHAHSDCGHYASPHLNRSHSLLRNFSLRSRNTLRKRQIQGHRPLQSLSAGILRTDSTSASMSSGSSILSVWKKWVKSVTNLSTADGQDGELVAITTHHHACLQGPARKRTQILPDGRSSTLPPSDDSPSIIIVSFPSI